nr:MAG TPA: hypothetical protein [Crassvirales sp.]
MEAIKNLRESSVLLSNVWCSSYAELAMALWSPVANIVLDELKYNGTNGNIDDIKRAVDRCAEGCIANYLADIVKAYATDIEYRALFDGLVAFDSQKYDTFVDAEERGEIGYDVPEEEQECELSTLLSNLNMSNYDELAERIYSFSRVEECLYYDTDEEESMGWVEKIVLDSAEARDRDLMAGISMFATEEEYRILYGKLCGMAQMSYWLDLDMELTQNAAIAAEEMARESAFISDEFEVFFDEETGEYKVGYTGERLTAEDYEEMERLEVDDNFHASFYEADCLPF